MEARSWSGVGWSEGSPDQKLQDLHHKLVNLKDDMTKLNEESGGQLLFVSSAYMIGNKISDQVRFESLHEKTGFLHMRKQRRRSASR